MEITALKLIGIIGFFLLLCLTVFSIWLGVRNSEKEVKNYTELKVLYEAQKDENTKLRLSVSELTLEVTTLRLLLTAEKENNYKILKKNIP